MRFVFFKTAKERGRVRKSFILKGASLLACDGKPRRRARDFTGEVYHRIILTSSKIRGITRVWRPGTWEQPAICLPLNRGGSLHNRQDLVGANVFDLFDQPAGPSDLQTVYFCGGAEPKMGAKIALGNIAATTSHFLYLLMTVGAKGDSSADGVAIRFGPRQATPAATAVSVNVPS